MGTRGCLVVLAVLTLLASPVQASPGPLIFPVLAMPSKAEVMAWRLEEACKAPLGGKAQAFIGATWKSVAIIAIIAAAVVTVTVVSVEEAGDQNTFVEG